MSTQSPTLFISLGTSPAIVPEAFLFPEVEFQAVHVLTTARPAISLVQDFFSNHYPDVHLTISRVDGFDDFVSESDHFLFEEVLYRWILNSRTSSNNRWFCLSGGFKTMSAAVQKAAGLFGSAGVFHVLAPSDIEVEGQPNRFRAAITIPEILDAYRLGKLQWIQLGAQPGWPQFRKLHEMSFPLNQRFDEGVDWLSSTDLSLRQFVESVESRAKLISHSWDALGELPFSELASWPESDLAWLQQPLDPDSISDFNWVKALPKLELHCHLGGFATGGELLEQVEAAAADPRRLRRRKLIALPEGWPIPAMPTGLEVYRKLGDNNGSSLLRDPGCLRKQCELLYQHFLNENIIYAEVRCSPANYSDPTLGRSPWMVLSEIRQAFQDCMMSSSASTDFSKNQKTPCHVNLIIIGTRQTSGDYRAGISRHLALAVTASEHWRDENSCRVVGVDLAGFEDPTTRAHYFREEFTAVHRCGLALTVHAGENDDAEGIWRAVFDLNARRLGHALSLDQSSDLMRSVADRGIGIEMCPFANLQIRGFVLESNVQSPPATGDNHSYPLQQYLKQGLKVTVNTDNIGISAATLSENLQLAARLCPGLKRLDLLQLQRNALDTAFETAIRKRVLLASINQSVSKLLCSLNL